MAMEGHWGPLYLHRDGLPRLLVKYTITRAGYTVFITDLANIWIEDLSTAQIVANAERQACSINPGDDVGQLRILLEKIRHVLCNEQGTSVRIRLQDPDDLTLKLHAPLPAPLPPLEWTMALHKASSADLATEVVSPLLLLAHQQQQQVKYLLGQLRDKDHVMSRLLDKMESTNTDLGSVFPGVSGGRSSQRSLKRAHVEKHVKGLAVFQPGSELQHSGGIPSADDLYGVLRDVSDGSALTRPSVEPWWKSITNYDEGMAVNLGQAANLDDDETDDDLDFQTKTQTIPEHLQRQRPANISSPNRPLRNLPLDDSISTDEPQLRSSPPLVPQDVPLSATATPAPESPGNPVNTQTKRIGMVGRSSSQVPLPSSPAKVVVDRKRDSRSRTNMSPTPPMMPPPQNPPTPSKMRRLGAIGRGSSQMQASQRGSSQALPTLEEDMQHHDRAASQMPPPARADHEDRDEERQTRSTKRKASEDIKPPVRETSVERANKKREELKQNIGAQAKGPTKKKRRF